MEIKLLPGVKPRLQPGAATDLAAADQTSAIAALGRALAALVHHVMVTQEIASGDLACPSEALHKPQVRAFRNWLLGEVALFKAQAGKFLV